MAEDKTLLSQNEIDTLIAFLTNSDSAPIGAVLEQKSIDKLIELIKYNNKRGLFIGEEESDMSNIAVLDPEKDLDAQRKDFELVFKKDNRDYVEILCINKNDGTTYRLTPGCLLHNRHIEDDTEWGSAISPLNFNRLALLFGISYSSETFREVCNNFSKVVYGYEDAEIPAIYYPPEESEKEN